MGIQEAKGKFSVVLYTDYDEWWRLGEYKTKKRALEVLDEIQNILDKRKNFDEMAKYIDNGTQIIEFSTAIYEMPQE